MDQDKIKGIASQLRGFLGDACGDMAGFDEQDLMVTLDEKEVAKVKAAKRDGVTDICGWYADKLYNDKDTIRDLMGDRIHDAADGSIRNMIAIATELKENSHNSMNLAMDDLIGDWEQRLEERHNKDGEPVSGKRRVHSCPACRSSDLKYIADIAVPGSGQSWKCNSCNEDLILRYNIMNRISDMNPWDMTEESVR